MQITFPTWLRSQRRITIHTTKTVADLLNSYNQSIKKVIFSFSWILFLSLRVDDSIRAGSNFFFFWTTGFAGIQVPYTPVTRGGDGDTRHLQAPLVEARGPPGARGAALRRARLGGRDRALRRLPRRDGRRARRAARAGAGAGGRGQEQLARALARRRRE